MLPDTIAEKIIIKAASEISRVSWLAHFAMRSPYRLEPASVSTMQYASVNVVNNRDVLKASSRG